MSTYKQFSTDTNKEVDGVKVDFGTSGVFTIARAGGANKKFQRTLEAKTRPFKRQIQSGTLTDEQSNQILIQCYAETVVLGWEGVTDRDGHSMAFSVENAVQLFKDLPDLFRVIRESADDAALFRAEELKVDLGN